MSGIGQSEEGVEASTSMMETSMMEGEDYYNPDDTSTWTQKEMSEQLCRICAKPNQYLIPIFEGEGIEHQLETKIQKHLPIEVSETDELPLQVCYQCASTLIAWNDLVIACIEADKKLRQALEHQEEEEDEKGPQLFDEPVVDSDEGEEPSQPSTSCATATSGTQIDTSLTTQKSAGKAKKSKLQTSLLKNPTAGPSGQKIPTKKTGAISKDDVVHEGTERFPHALGNVQHPSAKYQRNKKIPLYFVCDICFQPFKTERDVLSHKRQVHPERCLETENGEMPLEVNIKEQHENHASEQDFDVEGSIQGDADGSSSEEGSNSKDSLEACSKIIVETKDVLESRSYELAESDSVQRGQSVIETHPEFSDENEELGCNVSSRKLNPKHPRLFPCDMCEKSFTRNYDMHKHRLQQHPESTKIVVDVNGTMLNSTGVEHTFPGIGLVRVNLKPYRHRNRKGYGKEEEEKLSKAQVVVDGVKFYHCDICNHHLKSKYSYITHLRIHTGEKPFTCHICGKQFRVWEQLQRHVSDVHDKIKNYECNICGRKFATVNTRNEHLFTHSQERTFICHMCGKAFRSNGTLRVHYKFHRDVFPHQCPHCDKRFRMRQHFENHIRVHTGEKPHACKICGKHFRTNWCVKKHTLIHTSTETFECVVCRKHYSQKRYLRNHMRLSHGVRFSGNRMTD